MRSQRLHLQYRAEGLIRRQFQLCLMPLFSDGDSQEDLGIKYQANNFREHCLS